MFLTETFAFDVSEFMDSSDGVFGHYARELQPCEIKKLKDEKIVISEYKQHKLEVEARKNWDLFYKRNKDKFFKDRHWTTREFEELTDDVVAKLRQNGREKPVLLEVGCGVGNFIFPLIEVGTQFFLYACDFSPRAIQMVKENSLYNEDVCNAFVCDVTCEELTSFVPENTVDVATLIFVLSSIHPDKMSAALQNIYKVLRPGGILLFRDYGLYDQAMLRFKAGHKLDDHFYMRQDGTRAYYFSEEYLENLMKTSGFKVLKNSYVTRKTVNLKENICVPRVYIQGKFTKPV